MFRGTFAGEDSYIDFPRISENIFAFDFLLCLINVTDWN